MLLSIHEGERQREAKKQEETRGVGEMGMKGDLNQITTTYVYYDHKTVVL